MTRYEIMQNEEIAEIVRAYSRNKVLEENDYGCVLNSIIVFENDETLIKQELTSYGTQKKLVLRAYFKENFEIDYENSLILGFKSINRENLYEK
jgi:hypothetical protein